MRPEFLGHFLRAFYLSERPGAVTELLRGLREALAPENGAQHLPQLFGCFPLRQVCSPEDISTAPQEGRSGLSIYNGAMRNCAMHR